MNEQEQLDRFEKQQSDLWREFRDYQQQAISISIDQEELQARARERGIPPERAGELIREAALELHNHVISNSVNGSATEPPQKPSWWKVISPEDDQRRTMDAFDRIRPMAQEYLMTRSQVLSITSSSDPERLEVLRKNDKILMACLDGAAGDLQIMLTMLARPALIIDEAEPPETRFPKIVRDVLGTPRSRARGEDADEQEYAAEVYYAGSKFFDDQYTKLKSPEQLDPDYKLDRNYICQAIIGKNADSKINSRLHADKDRIGLTPKIPVIKDEAKQLDRVRRNPKEIDPQTFESPRDFAGDEVVSFRTLIEIEDERRAIHVLFKRLESTLPDKLKPLHRRHLDGIGLTRARRTLGLTQSDENNYRNRLKRFYEKSFCEKHFCEKTSQKECPSCQRDGEPSEIV